MVLLNMIMSLKIVILLVLEYNKLLCFLCGIDKKNLIKWNNIVKFVINIPITRTKIFILDQTLNKNLVKCEHIVLSSKNIEIKNVDEAFLLYIIEHNKKFGYYHAKCQFKIVFNNYDYSSYIMYKLSDNRTMTS